MMYPNTRTFIINLSLILSWIISPSTGLFRQLTTRQRCYCESSYEATLGLTEGFNRKTYHRKRSFVIPTKLYNQFFLSGSENEVERPTSTVTTLATTRIGHIESNRLSMVRIIEQSWQKVCDLIGLQTLEVCEQELKAATSMLVLATIKRLADENHLIRETIEGMLREADVNQDGQLTFTEWQSWLGRKSLFDHGDQDINVAQGPMMIALSAVLGHAITTLQVSSRLSNDPIHLTAAFISGGILSGVIDGAISDTLISRLSPAVRETVTLALTLEAASFQLTSSRPSSVYNSNLDIANGNKQSIASVERFEQPQMKTAELISPENTITTVDLSSVPILTAPPINEPVETSPILNEILERNAEIDEAENINYEENINARNRDVYSTMKSEGINEKEAFDRPAMDSDLDFVESTKMPLVDELDETLSNLSRIWDDIHMLRGTLRDISDKQALQMRKLLMEKSNGSTTVLGLAISLRASRLQHSMRLRPHIKHRLALETLQLWSPLSYQLGISQHTPELEVHSYVLLFPNSFGRFLGWYGNFRDIAKTFLFKFKSNLEEKLRSDEIMPKVSSKVVIQSRLKTPSSAFKKMVKGAKQKDDMHDLLGLRLIITSSEDIFQYQPDILSPPAEEVDRELVGIFRALQLVSDDKDWLLDDSRLKDYVTKPKPSGYQSIHATLVHKVTGISMEVQIRSSRMHWVAENGPASHNHYKALILPSA